MNGDAFLFNHAGFISERFLVRLLKRRLYNIAEKGLRCLNDPDLVSVDGMIPDICLDPDGVCSRNSGYGIPIFKSRFRAPPDQLRRDQAANPVVYKDQ